MAKSDFARFRRSSESKYRCPGDENHCKSPNSKANIKQIVRKVWTVNKIKATL